MKLKEEANYLLNHMTDEELEKTVQIMRKIVIEKRSDDIMIRKETPTFPKYDPNDEWVKEHIRQFGEEPSFF